MSHDLPFFDRVIGKISPKWAVERAKNRAAYTAYYEAASPTRLRKRNSHVDYGSADLSMQHGGYELMVQARELEQNYDIASGALDIFVARIVGSELQIEPQIRSRKGELLTEFNQEVKSLWQEWMESADINGSSGAQVQRIGVRTWMRDGGFLTRFLEGMEFPHNTRFPISLQHLEYDCLPYHLNKKLENGNLVVQGIEKNSYKQSVAYWLKKHFYDGVYETSSQKLEKIPAGQIIHTSLTKRFNQTRGVSAFHATFTRLADVRNYDESERMAARMAAAISAQLVTDKEAPIQEFDQFSQNEQADFEFQPGMFFDRLNPGQEIKIVSSDRPNSQLEAFRRGQLRMAAAGLGLSYGDLAREYTGTYSSERQANLDSAALMRPLQNEFAQSTWAPIYTRFLKVCVLYNLIDLPKKIDLSTLYNNEIKHPVPKSIDPEKEAGAKRTMLELGITSRRAIIREDGKNPDVVDKERQADLKREQEAGLSNNQNGEEGRGTEKNGESK